MASDKQVILVTGASSGVGYDTAYALTATTPTNHVIMGVRNLAKGETCLAELQARKPKGILSLLELDVTSDKSVDAAAKKLEADFGRVDVLINNAGIAIKAPHATRPDLRVIFETNVFGPTMLTLALKALLQRSSAPRVINVTSELGSIASRADPTSSSYAVGQNPYRMSKAALNMLTVCQQKELGEFGCKVWAFCPGFVVTNLTGEGDRQWRKDLGGESSETSAQGIVEIVEGKRDGEVGGFVTKYGKAFPW
ncbi:short chain dehydrogenase [Lentithecium fluviatile CBS 122367]|uniref:Short chain dehydrogenase n=1 Tax=Lentithecium fluviatile CBS 122367 TaxID=1168545 RepID=A0A6G1J0S9_9PLEO|nr:short chain dehydrogenase [Lentithecium fluviatile CBS 122367]